ncbi:MAG: hypothetical protein AAGB27_06775 [Pseudomonadota bacterium]
MSLPPQVRLDTPDWFCQQLDLPTRRFLLRPMTADSYRRSLFLDDRIAAPSAEQQIVAMEACREPLAEVEVLPALWVFHHGHCGSTYLSRMLEQLSPLLALREPMTLRALAVFQRDLESPLSLMDPTDFDGHLDQQLRLLTRRYEPSLPTLVKATSDCGGLAGPLLASHPEHRALRVGIPLESYLQTMLRSELRRQELYHFSQTRLADLQALGLGQSVRLYQLTPGELAAMSWLAVNRSLDAAEAELTSAAPGERVLRVDFERFLAEPVTQLARIAAFYGITPSVEQLEQAARGEIAQGYSKDPAMRYDRSSRQAELEHSARENADEIQRGLRWAEAFEA